MTTAACLTRRASPARVRPGCWRSPSPPCAWARVPSSGGGYFRLLPYGISHWLLSRVNRVDGESAVFYFHPGRSTPSSRAGQGIDAKTLPALREPAAHPRRASPGCCVTLPGPDGRIFLSRRLSAPAAVSAPRADERPDPHCAPRRADATACARWNAFCVLAPGHMTFFRRAGWLRVIEQQFSHA